MAVRQIRYDDKDPQLRQKAQPVTEFNAELRALVADMIDTMRSADGIGLAAPQIGVPLRLFVIEIPEGMDFEGSSAFEIVIANPRIVDRVGEVAEDEGCLSIPGWYGTVRRAAMVTVTGQDIDGKKISVYTEELPARALQHETDHLNGILYADRVEDPDTFYRVVSKDAEPPKALESIPVAVQKARVHSRRKDERARSKTAHVRINAVSPTLDV